MHGHPLATGLFSKICENVVSRCYRTRYSFFSRSNFKTCPDFPFTPQLSPIKHCLRFVQSSVTLFFYFFIITHSPFLNIVQFKIKKVQTAMF